MEKGVEIREMTDAPPRNSSLSERRFSSAKRELFVQFSAEILQPIAVLSGMQLCAILGEDENIFPESAPEICRAARLESKTRSICQRSHQELRAKVRETLRPQQNSCPFGYHIFSLPIVALGQLHGFIEGGRVFRGQKSPVDAIEPLKRALNRSRWGELAKGLNESYFATALLKNSDWDLWLRVLSPVAADLALKVSELSVSWSETEHPAILKAISYVRQHLADSLTPAFVARFAGVSDNYFTKLFKREMGMTFSEFLARERICKACGLLLETGQNVSDIAFAVGFDSIPYFNRCFKNQTQTSPGAYRLDRPTKSVAAQDQKKVPDPQFQRQVAISLDNS